MSSSKDPTSTECNGICLWAADIGVPEAGDVVAYAHPGCPAHGEPGWCNCCDDQCQHGLPQAGPEKCCYPLGDVCPIHC